MDATVKDSWVGKWVRYNGTGRPELRFGGPYEVIEANSDSVAFDAGIYGLQWCNKGKVIVEDTPKKLVDDPFIEAAGGPRSIIVAEIDRLKARLSELETALKVIDSL